MNIPLEKAMPTDLDFANDLNLDATDTVQIVKRLTACVHFMQKIDSHTTRINQVLAPSGPPIHPDIKTQVTALLSLSERVLSAVSRLNELPVQPGLGDGGE